MKLHTIIFFSHLIFILNMNGCRDGNVEYLSNDVLMDIVDSPEFPGFSESPIDLVDSSKSDIVRFMKIKKDIVNSKFNNVFPEPEVIMYDGETIGIYIVRDQLRMVVLKENKKLPLRFVVLDTIVKERIYSVERVLRNK